MIGAIGMDGSLRGLYPQYQAGKIQKAQKVKGFYPQEKTDTAVVKSQSGRGLQEEEALNRYAEKLKDQIADPVSLSYAANPYEQQRKAMEGSFLTGQSVDCYA